MLETAAVSSTCWQALCGGLRRRRRRAVRRNLREQRLLLRPLTDAMARPSLRQDRLAALSRHAATRGEARAVERLRACSSGNPHPSLGRRRLRRLENLLAERCRWLRQADAAARAEANAWMDEGAWTDAVMLRGLVRIYAKAGRRLRRAPQAAGACRWVGHQARVLQLLGAADGRTDGGRLHTVAAGTRQLQALLEESGWLHTLIRWARPGGRADHGLSSKELARLARLARARRGELLAGIELETQRGFGQSPREFAAELPWEYFRSGVVSRGCAAAARWGRG